MPFHRYRRYRRDIKSYMQSRASPEWSGVEVASSS